MKMFWLRAFRVMATAYLRNIFQGLPLKHSNQHHTAPTFDWEHSTSYRTSFFDLDMNVHMNNARYLNFGDFGRIDFLVRSHLLKALCKDKGQFVMAGAHTRFRRSLAFLQKFTVTTSYLGHDSEWFYFCHDFRDQSDHVVCSCISRACAVVNRKMIDIPKFLEKHNIGFLDISIPEHMIKHLRQWDHFDDWSYDFIKNRDYKKCGDDQQDKQEKHEEKNPKIF
jgi:acyl-CoA thioesterase FadM